MNRILLVRRPGLSELARWKPAWLPSPDRRLLHLTCARRTEATAASSETETAKEAPPTQRRRARGPQPPEGVPWRTRFAPSPTGFLHLGSLRTALFNYLAARQSGGQFILRIEDTDRTRLVPGAEERLYRDLKWAGLSWDEGPDVTGSHGPYRQSERLSLYKKHADELLSQGKAFRCFCSQEQASTDRQDGIYSGVCRTLDKAEVERRLAAGDRFAVRFKSSRQPVVVQDVVYGRYVKKKAEDDFIIMKRDGYPTYHFANVVDDRHMDINIVIRGVEWLISTPMHVDLYSAFGWKPPAFAHVGLLTDTAGRKLSKRDPTVDISSYQERDTLPPALLNFAALLGWSGPPGRSQFLTLQEMVDQFTLKFTKGNIIVKPEKLEFFQSRHWLHLLHEEPPQMDLLDPYLISPMAKRIWEVDIMLKNARRVGESKSAYRYATVTPAAFDSSFAADSAAVSGPPRSEGTGETGGAGGLEGAKTTEEANNNNNKTKSDSGKETDGDDVDGVGLDKPFFLGGLDRRANGLLNATPDDAKSYLLSMLRHSKRTFPTVDFAVSRFRYIIWRPSLFAYRRAFDRNIAAHAGEISVAGAASTVDGAVTFFERQLGAVPETAAETTMPDPSHPPPPPPPPPPSTVAATDMAADRSPQHEFVWLERDEGGAEPAYSYRPWDHDQLQAVMEAALGKIDPEATATAASNGSSKMDHGQQQLAVKHNGANKLGYAILRWALLASSTVPGLAGVMRLLGKREVMARLRRARESLLPPGARASLVVPAWLRPYLAEADGHGAGVGGLPIASDGEAEGAAASAGAGLPSVGVNKTA